MKNKKLKRHLIGIKALKRKLKAEGKSKKEISEAVVAAIQEFKETYKSKTENILDKLNRAESEVRRRFMPDPSTLPKPIEQVGPVKFTPKNWWQKLFMLFFGWLVKKQEMKKVAEKAKEELLESPESAIASVLKSASVNEPLDYSMARGKTPFKNIK